MTETAVRNWQAQVDTGRSRSDNTSVDQAHIPADNPADNRPHALPRLPANSQVTTLEWPWFVADIPSTPPNPRPTAGSREKFGGVGRLWAAGEGNGRPRASSRATAEPHATPGRTTRRN
ncbi:hypothetical protein ACIQMV_32325 [Streptomyces sp. NPDC091412]|uniref:hypothetical protein n=1 Tax=Streptomyces sp. NPDC091412 TaxID=3366002 RepID=UPI003829767E